MNEKSVKRSVRIYLNSKENCLHYPYNPGFGGTPGVADRIGTYKGLSFWIECKGDGNKPTKNQKIMMDKHIRAGGYGCWAIGKNWRQAVDEMFTLMDIELNKRRHYAS